MERREFRTIYRCRQPILFAADALVQHRDVDDQRGQRDERRGARMHLVMQRGAQGIVRG